MRKRLKSAEMGWSAYRGSTWGDRPVRAAAPANAQSHEVEGGETGRHHHPGGGLGRGGIPNGHEGLTASGARIRRLVTDEIAPVVDPVHNRGRGAGRVDDGVNAVGVEISVRLVYRCVRRSSNDCIIVSDDLIEIIYPVPPGAA